MLRNQHTIPITQLKNWSRWYDVWACLHTNPKQMLRDQHKMSIVQHKIEVDTTCGVSCLHTKPKQMLRDQRKMPSSQLKAKLKSIATTCCTRNQNKCWETNTKYQSPNSKIEVDDTTCELDFTRRRNKCWETNTKCQSSNVQHKIEVDTTCDVFCLHTKPKQMLRDRRKMPSAQLKSKLKSIATICCTRIQNKCWEINTKFQSPNSKNWSRYGVWAWFHTKPKQMLRNQRKTPAAQRKNWSRYDVSVFLHTKPKQMLRNQHKMSAAQRKNCQLRPGRKILGSTQLLQLYRHWRSTHQHLNNLYKAFRNVTARQVLMNLTRARQLRD